MYSQRRAAHGEENAEEQRFAKDCRTPASRCGDGRVSFRRGEKTGQVGDLPIETQTAIPARSRRGRARPRSRCRRHYNRPGRQRPASTLTPSDNGSCRLPGLPREQAHGTIVTLRSRKDNRMPNRLATWSSGFGIWPWHGCWRLGGSRRWPAIGRKFWARTATASPTASSRRLAGAGPNPVAAGSRQRLCRRGRGGRARRCCFIAWATTGGRGPRRSHRQAAVEGRPSRPATKADLSRRWPAVVPLVHRRAERLPAGPGRRVGLRRCSTRAKSVVAQCLSRFAAPEGYFGAGSSPIVEDDKLLLNVGGKGTAASRRASWPLPWPTASRCGSRPTSWPATRRRWRPRIDGVRHVDLRHAIECRLARSGERCRAVSIPIRCPRPDRQRGQSAGAGRPPVRFGQLWRRSPLGQISGPTRRSRSGTATT